MLGATLSEVEGSRARGFGDKRKRAGVAPPFRTPEPATREPANYAQPDVVPQLEHL